MIIEVKLYVGRIWKRLSGKILEDRHVSQLYVLEEKQAIVIQKL